MSLILNEALLENFQGKTPDYWEEFYFLMLSADLSQQIESDDKSEVSRDWIREVTTPEGEKVLVLCKGGEIQVPENPETGEETFLLKLGPNTGLALTGEAEGILGKFSEDGSFLPIREIDNRAFAYVLGQLYPVLPQQNGYLNNARMAYEELINTRRLEQTDQELLKQFMAELVKAYQNTDQ